MCNRVQFIKAESLRWLCWSSQLRANRAKNTHTQKTTPHIIRYSRCLPPHRHRLRHTVRAHSHSLAHPHILAYTYFCVGVFWSVQSARREPACARCACVRFFVPRIFCWRHRLYTLSSLLAAVCQVRILHKSHKTFRVFFSVAHLKSREVGTKSLHSGI